MAQTVNTFSFEIEDGKMVYAPDLSGVKPISQGQIAVWDATLNSGNGGVRPPTTQADMANNFAGVAEQNSVLNSLNEQLPTVRVGFKNVYMFNTTAAEVYKHGTKVYFNETADAFTVTSNTNTGARTVAVGYVCLPNSLLMAGTLTLTGAAGVQVPVAVVAIFPVASIA